MLAIWHGNFPALNFDGRNTPGASLNSPNWAELRIVFSRIMVFRQDSAFLKLGWCPESEMGPTPVPVLEYYSQLSDVCKNDCYCIWAKNGPEPQDFGVMQ